MHEQPANYILFYRSSLLPSERFTSINARQVILIGRRRSVSKKWSRMGLPPSVITRTFPSRNKSQHHSMMAIVVLLLDLGILLLAYKAITASCLALVKSRIEHRLLFRLQRSKSLKKRPIDKKNMFLSPLSKFTTLKSINRISGIDANITKITFDTGGMTLGTG